MKVKNTILEVVLINIVKWAAILVAFGFILCYTMPKYDYIDPDTRYNKVKGEVEEREYSTAGTEIWVHYVD